MKILQINSVVDYGSTGRIVRNLYDYLEEKGHECLIAFGRGESTSSYNTFKIGSDFDQVLHGIYSRLTDRHGFGSRFATKKLIKKIEEYNPDVIHLHNLHGYYINIGLLFKYLAKRRIPIVWLLHDQWTISGHSANFRMNSDGTLPTKLHTRKELKNYPKTIGISQFGRNLKNKEALFTSIDYMKIVTPSKWLENIAKKSFLNKYSISTIYNGIDTEAFNINKTNSSFLRKKWKADNKVIILGVASVWDERKGINDFIELAQLLSIEQYQVVLVGVDEKTKEKLPENIISITRTNSVRELRDIYNVSDIFVNPTYFDNFPTVNIEALACGTPVITYETGGSPESINLNTGSVVNQGNVNMLIKEIKKWGNKKEATSILCRNHVMTNFSKKLVYSEYEKIYYNLVNESL